MGLVRVIHVTLTCGGVLFLVPPVYIHAISVCLIIFQAFQMFQAQDIDNSTDWMLAEVKYRTFILGGND
ncbi:MAG: hypothetical protein E7541_03375 [Ruminococcaceae bacterium]|nr:hypothetical protein [Oscillospiraceae bacterium]